VRSWLQAACQKGLTKAHEPVTKMPGRHWARGHGGSDSLAP